MQIAPSIASPIRSKLASHTDVTATPTELEADRGSR